MFCEEQLIIRFTMKNCRIINHLSKARCPVCICWDFFRKFYYFAHTHGEEGGFSQSRNNHTYPGPNMKSLKGRDKRPFEERTLVRHDKSMPGSSVACCYDVPRHLSRCVKEHSHQWFPNHWVGRGRPQTWPPRSLDPYRAPSLGMCRALFMKQKVTRRQCSVGFLQQKRTYGNYWDHC